MSNMEYMFQTGFLGTRAPFFMDVVTIIVALLPFLIAGAIALARNKKYKYHAFAQMFIFTFSALVLVYFETGVRVGGGFGSFMQESRVSHAFAYGVLIFHIAISIATVLIWTTQIFMAKKLLLLNKHRKYGFITFTGIVMTSLTGIWVYLLMFVY